MAGPTVRAGPPDHPHRDVVSPGTRSSAVVDRLLRSPTVSATGLAAGRGATDSAQQQAAWKRARLVALLAYVIARVCIIVGAAAVSTARDVRARELDPTLLVPESASTGIFDVLNSWDGRWYYEIIRTGYPRRIPPDVTFGMLEARAAFFPVFPFMIRALDRVLPGGDVLTTLIVNNVLGFVAVLLVGLLARRLFDIDIAERSMVLMALFPGSFVLSFAYSEALMFVLVACCLLLLHQERWALAGVVAALVTASRPNGVAICFACAAAAVIAIHRKRAWRSLVAPALSPFGWVAFQVLLSRHADERGVWFRVQREAWDEGISFGLKALDAIGNALVHPLSSPANLLTLSSVAAMLIMIYASISMRLPWPWLVYSAVVLALMLMPSTVTARPRFLYTAFPLLIGVAAWWPKRWTDQWSWLMVACGGGLVLLPVLYGGFAAIP